MRADETSVCADAAGATRGVSALWRRAEREAGEQGSGCLSRAGEVILEGLLLREGTWAMPAGEMVRRPPGTQAPQLVRHPRRAQRWSETSLAPVIYLKGINTGFA